MTVEFSNPNNLESIKLPSLVIAADSSTIRDYLALTEKVPALLIFIHPEDESSKALVATVSEVVKKLQGAIFALVVDATKSPELTQAFELTQIPSVFGLLKGQPAPLFTGNQPIQQVQLVVSKVLEVAKDNGLNSKALVVEAEPEPELSASIKAAYDAIDAGDYQAALVHYEKALLEKPNDLLAEEGKAQVNLLLRLDGKDIAALASSTPTNSSEQLAKADALIATGSAEAGFDLLLEVFGKTEKEEREPIRLRLVELFLVVGADNPAVTQARRNLSLLLF